MPRRHGGNDRLLVFEIAIDQSDADAGLGANIVHAGLVKAALGEANDRCIQYLGLRRSTIGSLNIWVDMDQTVNERSFIVKSSKEKVDFIMYTTNEICLTGHRIKKLRTGLLSVMSSAVETSLIMTSQQGVAGYARDGRSLHPPALSAIAPTNKEHLRDSSTARRMTLRES